MNYNIISNQSVVTYVPTVGCSIYPYIIPLDTLVSNSRDQQENNGDQSLCTRKHTQKYALLEKSRLKCTSNTY